MLGRLIPEPWKERLRARIRRIAWEGRREPGPLYRPFRDGGHAFVVPKAPDGASAGREPPVPPRAMWLGYAETEEEYLEGGAADVARMHQLARAHGDRLGRARRVLELGCAAGRMIRHIPAVAPGAEIWGTDICAEHMHWCQRHFASPFRFATTTTVPHLPFEDRFFDFIYCGSVFTHIEDLADAWLLELRRILSPGGQLYFTVHDDDTVDWLERSDSGHRMEAFLENQPLYREMKGRWAVLAIGHGPDSVVFYDTEYLLKKVSGIFEVLAREPHAYGYQTAILATRPERA